MSPQQDATALQAEAAQKLAEAEGLKKLAEMFPNLDKRVGRWNKVAYFSPDVNTKVDNFDPRHNCGCCSDSPLEIWPYFQTEFGKVYSDPPCFMVGERDPESYGDRAYSGWDTKMRDKGIPEEIITRVSHLFQREGSDD